MIPAKAVTPEVIEEVRRIKFDFEYYAKKYLRIRTKEGKLEPLTLNMMQRKINETVERLKGENKPVRLIILKYRQGGASTYTEGRIFHTTSTNELTNSLIVAHEEAASTNLFNMSKTFYDELPTFVKPMRKNSNSKEVVFQNPDSNVTESDRMGLRSKIKISTANNTDAGRSATIHNLHASEVAFWNDGEKAMLSLMQAVPNTPNTMVVIESTANGIGGYFYDQWQRAKRGESDFVALFFAWFEEPAYRMQAPTTFKPTDDEQRLIDTYGVDYDQLQWRRWCIANNCGGDENLFKQEYPSNDTEAFLTSGRPRFDTNALMEYLGNCRPGTVGMIEGGKLIPQAKGYVEVWEYPKRGKEYIIGADVAKGLATGDYSVAAVYDGNLNLVALWHGHIDPDLFAKHLIHLGEYYHDALIAVEENNHGLSVLNAMKDEYWNLYKRTSHNKALDVTKEELGWYTSEQTKKLAIDHLARMIRERTVGIKSKKMIEECLTYIIEDNGSTNAQQGSHDDTVMASAIALYVARTAMVGIEDIVTPVATLSQPSVKSPFRMDDNGRFVHESEVKLDDDGEWFRKAGW